MQTDWSPSEDEYLFLCDLFSKGDDTQKLSVVHTIPDLIALDSQATISRILPKIQQQLPFSPCEFHLAASRAYAALMERKIPMNLLHVVLQGIDSRDPIVANAWLDTLVKVIPTLSDVQIKNEILPLAIYKSSLNQPIFYRVASCRILGKAAVHPKLQPADVKRDILPITQSLCQDCNHEVRAAICTQLCYIAQGLGNIFPKANLLPGLVELAADDNMMVRAAAVQASVQILPLLTTEVKKSTMVPLIKKLCEKSLEQNDISSAAIAKDFGNILEGLQCCLAISDSIWFLQCFNTMSTRGVSSKISDAQRAIASQDVLCRQHCASNLPAVTYFVLSELPGHVDFICNMCHNLTADPCYIVRRTIASCIDQILKILGPQNKLLKGDVVRLFKDDAEEVLQMLVPHISAILDMLCIHGVFMRESTNQSTLDICRGLAKCHSEIAKGTNWRLMTKFLHQLEYLPNCVPGDFIHQNFTPNIVNLAVAGRAKPVRSQATRTLMVFLKHNSKEMQRKWLRETLISNLCYSKSCYTRSIYIQMCNHAINIFSNKYFKEYFFIPLMNLGEDKVSNIRLSLVNLLPTLKSMLQPQDRKLQMVFENTIRIIETQERDKDVIAFYQQRAKEANIPRSQAQLEDHKAEEKRKQGEEDDIAAGKWIPIPPKTVPSLRVFNSPSPVVPVPPDNPPHLSKSQSTGRASISGPRPVSKPVPESPSSSASRISDMSILEQHFYTDAGVNLPINTLNSGQQETKVFKTLIPKFVAGEDFKHVTDDKISKEMGKLKISKSELDIRTSRNKRHSSVFPGSSLDAQQKILNRRSLSAISMRDASRIPVSLKGFVKKKDDLFNVETDNNNTNETNSTQHIIKSEPSHKDIPSLRQNSGSFIPCFRSNAGSSCNTNKLQKTGLPVPVKQTASELRRK